MLTIGDHYGIYSAGQMIEGEGQSHNPGDENWELASAHLDVFLSHGRRHGRSGRDVIAAKAIQKIIDLTLAVQRRE